MTTATEFVRDAEKAALQELGFARSRGLYRVDLGPGIRGAVGLNSGTVRPGAVRIQPFVSVNHIEIQREIVARVGEGSVHDPTIVAHLGDVGDLEDFPELIVDSAASAGEVLRFIQERLTRSGIPWMQRMATGEGLADGLERFLHGQPEFPRPIAYRRIGRLDLAIASIDRTLRWYGDQPDVGSVASFRRFARSLRPELVAALNG